MQSLNEIRQHQNAVRQTRQITNAMYLLSTSRMRKAIQRVDYNLTYMEKLQEALKDILQKSGEVDSIYTHQRNERTLFVVLSSDKGLCGAYNANVLSLAVQSLRAYQNPMVGSVGLFGTEYLKAHGFAPDTEWLGASQKPSMYYARMIGEDILNLYDQGYIGQVFVVYTHYRNSALQQPHCVRLLPLSLQDLQEVRGENGIVSGDVICVPSPGELFNRVAPEYVVGMLYDMLNLSSASEHAARMNAMQSATGNADKMLAELNAQYNTTRQLAITSEITEIAAASELLRGAI